MVFNILRPAQKSFQQSPWKPIKCYWKMESKCIFKHFTDGHLHKLKINAGRQIHNNETASSLKRTSPAIEGDWLLIRRLNHLNDVLWSINLRTYMHTRTHTYIHKCIFTCKYAQQRHMQFFIRFKLQVAVKVPSTRFETHQQNSFKVLLQTTRKLNNKFILTVEKQQEIVIQNKHIGTRGFPWIIKYLQDRNH